MKSLTLALVAALAGAGAAFATGTTPAPSTTPAPAPSADEVRASISAKIAWRIKRGSRYMEGTCDAPKLDQPGYENLPVTSCTYTSIGVTARVLLLDAPAERVAAWIVTACQDAAASDLSACAKVMLDGITVTLADGKKAFHEGIWGASQAQFAVLGFVVEPHDAISDVDDKTPYCILFRDGITVGTKTWKSQAAANGSCGDESVWDEAALRTGSYARIASTTREEYTSGGGTKPTAGTAYLQTIRELYTAAWTADRNELVSAKAKARKAAGEIE